MLWLPEGQTWSAWTVVDRGLAVIQLYGFLVAMNNNVTHSCVRSFRGLLRVQIRTPKRIWCGFVHFLSGHETYNERGKCLSVYVHVRSTLRWTEVHEGGFER
jgi:hypothetical protein